MRFLALVAALLASEACVRADIVACGDLVCPVDHLCTPSGCATEDQVAACADKDEEDACSALDVVNGHCLGGVCRSSICGNDVIEFGEVCDGGNTEPGDGCSARCDSDETCGNLVVDPLVGEECDSGIAGRSGDGCTSVCTVELDSWREVFPRPIDGRSSAAMATDTHRARVVLFGGARSDSSTAHLDETWEWNGVAWVQKFPVISPPPRQAHSMVYDAVNRRIVLFGGVGASGRLADTWTWDGVEWEQHTPAVSPPSRSSASMAATPAGVLLFGGAGPLALGDTWLWNGSTWTDVTMAGGPSARAGAAIIYDPIAGRVMMHGGNTGSAALSETWTWSGGVWSPLTVPTAPSPRSSHKIVVDPDRSRLVMFGGRDGIGASLDQTWEWSAGMWQQIALAVRPTARSTHAMSYDPVNRTVLVFSGNSAPETWSWNGTVWRLTLPSSPGPVSEGALAYDPIRAQTVLYDGASTWLWEGTQWMPTRGTQPPPRSNVELAFDPVTERMLLFGGRDFAEPLTDTWTWDGSGWMEQLPAGSPPALVGYAMATDLARSRIVLACGVVDVDPATGTCATWEWDGTTWIERTSAHAPPARRFPSVAYDAARGVVVLHSGTNENVGTYTDTWEWDGVDWIERTGTVRPPAGRLVYHAGRQRVLLVGWENNDARQRTWEWNGTDWSLRAVAAAPPVRAANQIAYDAARARVIQYGGFFTSALQDTWLYGFESATYPADRCAGTDSDGDGLIGAADPDCYPFTDPLCAIGGRCTGVRPHCGDGTCSAIESYLTCPVDCPL